MRFDDPITLWLRSDVNVLDPDLMLRESADVFAYLDSLDAQASTRPHSLCRKATLHAVSATGGPGPNARAGAGLKGASPRRVLAPLAALLAMTGVLTDDRAQQVGV